MIFDQENGFETTTLPSKSDSEENEIPMKELLSRMQDLVHP